MRRPFSVAAFLLASIPSLAQPTRSQQTGTHPTASSRHSKPPAAKHARRYADRITAPGLRQDLTILASDVYEGRATGQPGQRLAATYLANALATAGLVGPLTNTATPFYQRFSLTRTGLDSTSSVTVGGRTFLVNKDFYVLIRNPVTASAPLQPAFVGYGINTPGYADFTPANLALKGKDLLILLGEPQTPAGQALLGKSGQASPYGSPGFAEVLERGPGLYALAPRSTIRIMPNAAAFARVPQDYANLYGWQDRIAFPGTAPPTATGPNVFFVSPEMGAALLGTTAAGLTAYHQAVAAAGKPIPSPFQAPPATLQVRVQTQPFTTENVLGYLEGTDKKQEVVVISAHYDHIGVQQGRVYNGADDDGSGTVSLLAMARAFAQAKKEGHGPRRSLLFLANVGEELDLLGSRYYTDHPVFPLAATVADLHLDMVGRVDSLHPGQGNYLYLIGDDWLSTDLHQLSAATNRQGTPLQLDYRYNTLADPSHLYYRSDHYSFAKHRVPVIYYFSGFHRDYHQPSDDVDKIDFTALTQRSRLIFRTAWAVANRAQRVQVDAEHQPTGFQPVAAELSRYTGKYVSAQVALKITIARVGESLEVQPEGQYPLALEPVSAGVFKVDQVGVRVEFDPVQSRFLLLQGGRRWLFTKS
ncbi:MAG: M28 family peptidase [Hymenobacter sp.]|nr:MAG: M28 family peptidase [Hymenobacter sp.]